MSDLPLFPLRSVVYPGGALPLRIFEPRYLDLVRDCARTDSGFGVVLLLEGSEGEPARDHAMVGTMVHIEDWFTHDDGLLGILGRGARRFRVRQTGMRDNGLLTAEVDWISPEPALAPSVEYSVLVNIVARYMEKAESHFPEFEPGQLGDAAFIGYRLAELLPLELDEKQSLLEMNEPLKRLEALARVLPRFQSD